MGIRAKLILCLLAVLIPLGAFSTFAIRLVDQQLTERTESALANTQRLEAARINEVLTGYEQDSRSLASDDYLREFTSALHKFRQAKAINTGLTSPVPPFIGGYGEFAIVKADDAWPLQQLALQLQRKAGIIGSAVVELRIVDRQGHTLGESLGFSWQPADTRLITTSMTQVTTLFGDAFRNASNQSRLGMVSPIIGHSDEVVGALVLEKRLGPILDLVSKHEGVANSSEAHIAQPTIHGHAQFITALRFDRKAAFNKIVPESKGLPINLSLHATDSRIVHAKDYRGVASILSIETIPATGWGLVVKIDSEEALRPVVELRRSLAAALVASLFVMLAGYMFCLLPIAHRLKRTSAAAQKMMNGDLTARVLDSNNDEIGGLARTIDTLAYELELDQKKRVDVEARLRHQALHDELTGLLNRKHANKVIQQLNDDSCNVHSVMFLDLNGFKDVNDLYGHGAGDEVLVTIAKRLTGKIGEGATLARWGGDEFVVILPHTGESDATAFALELHNAFDEPIVTTQGVHKITCSIGLATSSDTKPLDEVLMEADILMYEQKKRHYAKQSTGGITTRTVERALHEERVEAWYQPIVSLQRPGNYALAGVEAHVRLRTREGGIITAEELQPELTNAPVEAALDKAVINMCLLSLSKWLTTGIVASDFKLSLAISSQTLNHPDFSSLLACQLDSLNIPPSALVLELSALRVVESHKLATLRALGISFSMSKINAEPDILGRLSYLQPDIARIDNQWLHDPVVSPHLVAICQERSMRITVCGITSREELQSLHQLGIDEFQGQLFDHPLTAVDLISRWGRSSFQGIGHQVQQNLASLKLTG